MGDAAEDEELAEEFAVTLCPRAVLVRRQRNNVRAMIEMLNE